MIIAGRNRDYKELSNSLRAKKVLMFTCNTCVRLCGGLGGKEAANRLSEKLSVDGIEIVDTYDVSAACIGSKVRGKLTPSKLEEFDVILSLTCPLGAACIAMVSGKDVCNPIENIGIGYLDEDGVPIVISGSCDFPEESPAVEVAEEIGLKMSPFV